MYPRTLRMFSFFVALIVMLMSFSCKTTPFIPGEKKEQYIRFGNGGGFTGGVTVYYLTEKGDVYKEVDNTLTKLFRADAAFTEQLFAMPKILNIRNKPYNNPGNRYFFIEVSTETDQQKIVWGGDKIQIKEYETWYQNLMFMVKKENLNPDSPVK